MKTKDVVKGWVDLMIYGKIFDGGLRANSCRANGYYFISYDTPVAKFCGDYFEVATKKYSVTTSKLQNLLRASIPSSMLKEVTEIKDNGEFPWRR